ncbi:MAG: DUF1549 and DUF1553 domain-containing protein [Fimbriiglobus sp.]|jgi:hypothetical protein|nr:DUF1549 and DUF1553 domain-containing protein [Fimbriiglobus sp.]
MRFVRFLPALMFATAFALAMPVPAVGADPKAEKQAQKKKAREEAAKAAEEARRAEELKQAEAAKKADEARRARAAEAAKKQAAPPGKFDAASVAAFIDAEVGKKLTAEKLDPSPICTDAEFLRRAYLDITGVIPTAERAKTFLDDTSPDKRAKLIDELLTDPNYGRKQADVWLAKLFPRESNNRFVQPQAFHTWLAGEFNSNTPWDKFVSILVTAVGTVDEHPEVTFFLANRSVDKLTDAVSQHFLGVRLSCAQCHNHPFAPTKQAEYWGMAAFFSKVNAQNPKNPKKGNDNSDLGVQEGKGPTKAKDFFPESAKKVSAKFLGGPEPKLNAAEPYRPVLAAWMTDAANPFFAKAMANRTWAQMFGHGIVDPVDDLIEKNTPSHPELLDGLAKQFAAGGFDVKGLIRGIALSQTYQRSARPNGSNKGDSEFFSHLSVKQMTGEQLYDSLQVVLGADRDAGKKAQNQAGKGNVSPRDRFALFYSAGAEEVNPTAFDAGIPQVLKQLNSNNARIAAAAKSMTGTLKGEAAVEKLYLTALARRPTADEAKRLAEFLAQNPTEGPADLLWAILNSSEFCMIR